MAKVPEIFGSMVFNDQKMQERLPKSTYKALKKTIQNGEPLDLSVANVVAAAMKDWAVEMGCTHYTHWFQPMTGITAEKHDSFIAPNGEGQVIMEFSGKELVKGEPDASSFPSGGIRATFEARGYTTWDPTSYAFVKDGTLYIPTAFCSYTGEVLDKKTPLLRSMERINTEAVKILHLLGKEDVTRVTTTVGPEQEYFLIDREAYDQREDLIYTGRTLFGAKAPKGQELDDHYFGAIKTRVAAYMKDLDEELWKLGILAKTKHNEVAPSQHELAPIFTTTNIATDHNELTMEVMKKVAERHGLVCLLHEKPFAGVNGSGKHNNWSISTNTGENLLDPGKTPENNLQFQLFLAAVVKAVHEYQDLLRITVASAGNDHRLGANEAPPAIISMYLGDDLGELVDSIINDREYVSKGKQKMRTGVDVLPDFMKDTSDWLSNLSLRASYGAQGNDQVGYYAYQALYSIRNNLGESGLHAYRLATPNLSWETNLNTNIGLDFGFWNNRLSGTIEYFERRSKDLLFSKDLVPSSGFSSMDENIGAIKNYGWEFQISGYPIMTKDWKWKLSFNATTYKNKITSLPAEEMWSGNKKWVKGGSLYDFYLVEWAGVNPENGNPMWYRYNTNGEKVTTEDYSSTTPDDKVKCGNSLPDWTGGLQSDLSFKDFTLSFLFSYSIGGKIYNGDKVSLMSQGPTGTSWSVDMLDRWTPENPYTDVPRLTTSPKSSWTNSSNRFLVDRSYLRLKNITFSYNLPKSLLNTLTLKDASIFFQAENMLTLAKQQGLDPEQTFGGSTYYRYPAMKTISFGINVKL